MSSVLIVGAGLSGATLAERFAQAGAKVLVIDKRDHLAGNCFDQLDQPTGIRVSRYGAHLFHTNSQQVWDYLQQFASWRSYEHRVLVRHRDQLLPLPINLDSVNLFFSQQLQDGAQMRQFLTKKVLALPQVRSSADYVLSSLGPELYEAIFRNYSFKQWALDPSELDATVIKRNPVRFNRDDRYFTDRYQALPEGGFEGLVKRMLAHRHIELCLGVDFQQFRHTAAMQKFDQIFYTGPIDQYFDYRLGHLEYRSLDFHFETLPQAQYQPVGAVNYPDERYPFTRIIEYKHFYPPAQPVAATVISREFPTWDGEPYYPVPRLRNQRLLAKYQRLARPLAAQGIHFLGRLGSYRYINMDQAVAEALKLFEKVKEKKGDHLQIAP